MARSAQKRTVYSTDPGVIFCTDIIGLIHPTGTNGERYVAWFADVDTRYSFAIHLSSRSQINAAVTAALHYARQTTGTVPKILYSDNAS